MSYILPMDELLDADIVGKLLGLGHLIPPTPPPDEDYPTWTTKFTSFAGEVIYGYGDTPRDSVIYVFRKLFPGRPLYGA